jgi:regulator of RNase E activity RraA
MIPPRDSAWPDRLGRLYTAVVADVLDALGFRDQCLHPRVRPLWPGATLAGFALTVHVVPAREVQPEHPYAGELAAVDALQPGDVLVASESATGIWGELLSTAARHRGCRGVVLDGPTRDATAITTMGFPVFHVGCHPADSLGRVEVAAHDVPVDCGGVLIHPGDLVLADHDGVVAIPAAAADDVLRRAEEKVGDENKVRAALAAGMSATAAFEKYGVL